MVCRTAIVCAGLALGVIAPDIRTAAVDGDAGVSRPLVGLSVPSQTAMVAPEQSGKIVAIHVRDGQAVAEGDVLFELSSTLQRLQVERLRSLVESDLLELRAKTSLTHAERSEARVRELRSGQYSSDSELQDRSYEVAIARLRLEQAALEKAQLRNDLAQAEERLAQRTLRAPFDGIVTRRFKHVGETVEEFVAVLEVISTDPLWIEFECPVAREDEFRPGTEIRVAPAVRPTERRKATVTYASMQATPSSHTFLVRATVANRDRRWKAGLKMLIEPASRPATDPSTPGK